MGARHSSHTFPARAFRGPLVHRSAPLLEVLPSRPLHSDQWIADFRYRRAVLVRARRAFNTPSGPQLRAVVRCPPASLPAGKGRASRYPVHGSFARFYPSWQRGLWSAPAPAPVCSLVFESCLSGSTGLCWPHRTFALARTPRARPAWKNQKWVSAMDAAGHRDRSRRL